MSVNYTDFDKIWASTSPLTPYEFSESQYKEGWNFVGATPPSRQMWDFLQKNNDEKSKFLLDKFGEYLPLSGGTMTGNTAMSRSVDNLYLQINGGTSQQNGAYIRLQGKDNIGQFQIHAKDGTNDTSLVGKPDGTLTWDEKSIERVNASGTNYIRYESGLQICWGEETKSVTLTQVNSTGIYCTSVNITLPASFKDTNYVASAGSRYSSGYRLACGAGPSATGYFNCNVYDFFARNGDISIWWYAIGRWK